MNDFSGENPKLDHSDAPTKSKDPVIHHIGEIAVPEDGDGADLDLAHRPDRQRQIAQLEGRRVQIYAPGRVIPPPDTVTEGHYANGAE